MGEYFNVQREADVFVDIMNGVITPPPLPTGFSYGKFFIQPGLAVIYRKSNTGDQTDHAIEIRASNAKELAERFVAGLTSWLQNATNAHGGLSRTNLEFVSNASNMQGITN